ncbi:hypothetical protein ACOSQ2_007892 [Xanthoceras sorbifolium]
MENKFNLYKLVFKMLNFTKALDLPLTPFTIMELPSTLPHYQFIQSNTMGFIIPFHAAKTITDESNNFIALFLTTSIFFVDLKDNLISRSVHTFESSPMDTIFMKYISCNIDFAEKTNIN